jgi:hypothetical protein
LAKSSSNTSPVCAHVDWRIAAQPPGQGCANFVVALEYGVSNGRLHAAIGCPYDLLAKDRAKPFVGWSELRRDDERGKVAVDHRDIGRRRIEAGEPVFQLLAREDPGLPCRAGALQAEAVAHAALSIPGFPAAFQFHARSWSSSLFFTAPVTIRSSTSLSQV